MFFQGPGAGFAGGPGEAASDAALATLVHAGTEEGAGGGSSVDAAPRRPAGDRHTGLKLFLTCLDVAWCKTCVVTTDHLF